MRDLTVAERLIVAADFSPRTAGGISVPAAKEKVLALAEQLEGLDVYIKVNSILRAVGYGLIPELQKLGLKVCADLKLIEIPNTLDTDGEMLAAARPDMLTVMCCAGIDGMMAIKRRALSDTTEILGVTVLTTLGEEECQNIFGCPTKAGVLRFARMAYLAGLDGLILSPKELEVVNERLELSLTFNTPGVRPVWSLVEGDDQARVMTPKEAIAAGADRIILGRPIIGASPNDQGMPKSPREAVEFILDEIREGLVSRGDQIESC